MALVMMVCSSPRSFAQEGTCCTRDVTVVPCDMPEEQERDANKVIRGSIMDPFTTAWSDFDDCPLGIHLVDYHGAALLDGYLDAIARSVGVEKDPQAEEFAKSLLRFDYVMRPEVTLLRIDDIVPGEWVEGDGGEPWYEPGYVHGDWTVVFALEDVHHGQTVKQASTSWSGSLAIGAMQPMTALAEQFLPLDDLIHDYERMPESAAVIPESDEIESGRSMTVDLTDIRDSKGRISQPWQRVVVTVEKGRIIAGNGGERSEPCSEEPQRCRVFEVGDGSLSFTYRAPSECVDDVENMRAYNSCYVGHELAYDFVTPGKESFREREIATRDVRITCTPRWAWVGTLEMEQSWRFSCETSRQNGGDLQTLKQHDLNKIMVSMELEIDDIRVAEEGVDAKNEADISMSGTVTGLMTESRDVWSRGSAGWTHSRDTAQGDQTCGVGVEDSERMSIAFTGGGTAGADQIRALMDEMRSTTDPSRIAELNEQLLALMEPDADSGSLPLKIVVQYGPDCVYQVTVKQFAERQDAKGHRIDHDITRQREVSIGMIQIPVGEVPFAGRYEKDDRGVERIHGTFEGVVDRSPTGDSGLWGCPDAILFQSGELNLERRRVR